MKEVVNNQKVKLIHSVYLSHKNGANTVIKLLLNSKDRFKQNGIELDGLFPSESFRAVASGKGVKPFVGRIRKAFISFVRNRLSKAAQNSSWAAKMVIYLNEQHASKQIIKKYVESKNCNEDTVFFHTFFTCYYYLKTRKSNKQHVVLVLHTNGEPFKMERIYYPALEDSKYYNEMLEMEKFVLSNVEKVNFVSKASKETFIKHHPYIDHDKVFYIHNGVEYLPPLEKNKKDGPIEVCCVASITPRKGQHYIIEALQEVTHKPNVHFTIVGDGSDRLKLEEQVYKSRLKEYVTFTGITNEVDNYLNQSDIFILPSEDEGLPMAILEAMRASLPVVSTPVGGIPEIVEDGYNGYLIEPSVDGIKSFLDKLNNTDWEKMGNNSRKLFEEKFVLENMVDEYSKLLTF